MAEGRVEWHGEPCDLRAVGSMSGTASKWRVRYAEKRLADLDEMGALSRSTQRPVGRITLALRNEYTGRLFVKSARN